MAEAIKLTPFGTPIREFKPRYSKLVSEKTIKQYGLELDKETGSTYVVEKDPLDLHALIQSYKDQCGMTLAQNLMKRGLATQDDFAAKPGDYGDTSTLPDNINDAYQANLKAEQAAGSVDLSQFKTDADIKNYVDKLVADQLAAQKAAAQTGAPAEGDN